MEPGVGYNVIPRLLLDRGRVCNVEHLLAHHHAGNGAPPLVVMNSVRHTFAVGWQMGLRVVDAKLPCEILHVPSCWPPLILDITIRWAVFGLVMGNLDILALTGTSASSHSVLGRSFIDKETPTESRDRTACHQNFNEVSVRLCFVEVSQPGESGRKPNLVH